MVGVGCKRCPYAKLRVHFIHPSRGIPKSHLTIIRGRGWVAFGVERECAPAGVRAQSPSHHLTLPSLPHSSSAAHLKIFSNWNAHCKFKMATRLIFNWISILKIPVTEFWRICYFLGPFLQLINKQIYHFHVFFFAKKFKVIDKKYLSDQL